MRACAVIIVALLLQACVQTGPPQFEADLEEAARLNTKLGMSYLQQGNLEQALAKLQKALEQDDSQAQTYWGLALVHARFQENEKARGYFKQARKRAPKDANITASYGEFLCQLGEAEAAHKAFADAAKTPRYLSPEVAYTNAGVCYRKQGQRVPAEQSFRKALNYNPRFARALMQLASMSYEVGDYLRARAFNQRLEAQGHRSADSLLLALRTEHALGDARSARKYADLLRAQYPEIAKRFDLNSGKPW